MPAARSWPRSSRPRPTRSSGRLTYFRVWSGSIKSHDQVWNAARGEEERIGQVFYIKGKDAGAGRRDPRRRDRRRGQARAHPHGRHAVSSRERPLTMPPIAFPEPTLPVADRARLQGRPGQAQHRAVTAHRGGPDAQVERHIETGEQLLWAQGENQIAVAGERLKRKFGTSDRHPCPARPLSRDDPRHGQGRGPPQEADRRARPVRPRLAGDRAQPRRRRRVRRRSVVGGVGAQAVLPGRREGRP